MFKNHPMKSQSLELIMNYLEEISLTLERLFLNSNFKLVTNHEFYKSRRDNQNCQTHA